MIMLITFVCDIDHTGILHFHISYLFSCPCSDFITRPLRMGNDLFPCWRHIFSDTGNQMIIALNKHDVEVNSWILKWPVNEFLIYIAPSSLSIDSHGRGSEKRFGCFVDVYQAF